MGRVREVVGGHRWIFVVGSVVLLIAAGSLALALGNGSPTRQSAAGPTHPSATAPTTTAPPSTTAAPSTTNVPVPTPTTPIWNPPSDAAGKPIADGTVGYDSSGCSYEMVVDPTIDYGKWIPLPYCSSSASSRSDHLEFFRGQPSSTWYEAVDTTSRPGTQRWQWRGSGWWYTCPIAGCPQSGPSLELSDGSTELFSQYASELQANPGLASQALPDLKVQLATLQSAFQSETAAESTANNVLSAEEQTISSLPGGSSSHAYVELQSLHNDIAGQLAQVNQVTSSNSIQGSPSQPTTSDAGIATLGELAPINDELGSLGAEWFAPNCESDYCIDTDTGSQYFGP